MDHSRPPVHLPFGARAYPAERDRAAAPPRPTDRSPEELVHASPPPTTSATSRAPGAGYPTGDGGHVRRGVFYRSNELQLTAEDAASLAALGVSMLHDLRGDGGEIEAHPDVAVAGATWNHVAISGIPMELVAGLDDTELGRCA